VAVARGVLFIKAERRFELTPTTKLSHVTAASWPCMQITRVGCFPSRSAVRSLSLSLSLSLALCVILHLPSLAMSCNESPVGRGSSLYSFAPAIWALGLPDSRWRPSWIALPGPAIVYKGALFADGRFGSVTPPGFALRDTGARNSLASVKRRSGARRLTARRLMVRFSILHGRSGLIINHYAGND
jgi:hypothetical protein